MYRGSRTSIKNIVPNISRNSRNFARLRNFITTASYANTRSCVYILQHTKSYPLQYLMYPQEDTRSKTWKYLLFFNTITLSQYVIHSFSWYSHSRNSKYYAIYQIFLFFNIKIRSSDDVFFFFDIEVEACKSFVTIKKSW